MIDSITSTKILAEVCPARKSKIRYSIQSRESHEHPIFLEKFSFFHNDESKWLEPINLLFAIEEQQHRDNVEKSKTTAGWNCWRKQQ